LRGRPRAHALTLASLAVVCAENLVQDLLSDFEFELSPPYLLYRTGNEARRGVATARSRVC
jgi:hypothetical protein